LSLPAGIYGKLCKHKTGLLDGDYSLLFNKADHKTLEQIHEVVKKSKYPEIISSYNILREEIEETQKKEKKLKEQIEQALKAGIETV
jgi:site-specific DNA-adenine methylase